MHLSEQTIVLLLNRLCFKLRGPAWMWFCFLFVFWTNTYTLACDLLWCNNWNVDDWIDEACFLCCFWFTFYLVEMVSSAGYVSWITSLNHTWVAFECCGYTIFHFSLMALSFLFLFKKLHMCWAMQHPIYFASSWETLCAFFTISVWTKSFFKKYFQFFFLIIFKSNAFLKVFFVQPFFLKVIFV